MNVKNILAILCLFPSLAFGAERTEEARVGVNRMSQAAARMPNMVINTSQTSTSSVNTNNSDAVQVTKPSTVTDGSSITNEVTESASNTDTSNSVQEIVTVVEETNGNCRDAYRECMDLFCLLDESEGARCACSSNIEQAKPLIQEIQEIQAEADKLYTEGVEREQLGAKASLVFGESEQAKKSSAASGISFTDWINSGTEEAGLGTDSGIGDNLYAMAAEYCAS